MHYKTDDELIALLDDKSVKIGDTAAEILHERDQKELVYSALLNGYIKQKIGKIRALNILLRYGRTFPEAIKAYLKMINDKNGEVIDCALFGIVFWQDIEHLPTLKVLKNDATQDRIDLAITALKEQKPEIYSPHFRDRRGVWQM